MNTAKKIITTKYGWILFLMTFFSSLVVFQLSGRTWFLFLQILFCIIMLMSTKKFSFLPFSLINIIFLAMIISALSGLIGNQIFSYKKAAVVMAIYMIPMYFTATYCYSLMIKRNDILQIIVLAFKAMSFVQITWIPIQYVFYHLLGIDLNKLIFVNLFHFLENASFVRDWVWYPSGLTWHSAVLAPLFVISFFLFKNLPLKLLIIIDAVICGNSTAFIGVIICLSLYLAFLLLERLNQGKFRINPILMMGSIIVFLIVILLLYKLGLLKVLAERILYLWMRLFGNQSDASTSAHMQYYFDYITVLKKSNIFQILFGYGEGCSGYTISQIYNRYTGLGNWAVECDFVNIALNRGIVGFILYYIFLLNLSFKGLKKDKRYFIVMIAILIQGFGYNVQWDYILFIELIFFFCIKLDQNFFECLKKEKHEGE